MTAGSWNSEWATRAAAAAGRPELLAGVRAFRARSLEEAMQRIERELGPDAQVLHSRRVPGNWWERCIGRSHVEVWASRKRVPATAKSGDRPERQRADGSTNSLSNSPTPDSNRPRGRRAPSVDPQEIRSRLQPQIRPDASPASSGVDVLTDDSAEGLWGNTEADHAAQVLRQAFRQLVQAGAPEATARELVCRVYDLEQLDELSDLGLVRQAMARALRAEITTAPPVTVGAGQQRLMFVGPSGSGKTSMLAKLATRFRLDDQARVALLSIDTFRLAAPEQLRAFAEIVDSPCDIVATPRELKQSLRRHAEADVVLLDTAGRNPRDQAALQQLAAVVRQSASHHVILVLDATCDAQYLMQCAEAFAAHGATSLALTRLDQTSRLGNLIPLLQNAALPLAFFGTGPNLCDDYSAADLDLVLARMLGGWLPKGAGRVRTERVGALAPDHAAAQAAPAVSLLGASAGRT